jgi:hypothetical protein
LLDSGYAISKITPGSGIIGRAAKTQFMEVATPAATIHLVVKLEGGSEAHNFPLVPGEPPCYQTAKQ